MNRQGQLQRYPHKHHTQNTVVHQHPRNVHMTVCDLGSSNGTWLLQDGVYTKLQAHIDYTLTLGAVLKIADVPVVVCRGCEVLLPVDIVCLLACISYIYSCIHVHSFSFFLTQTFSSLFFTVLYCS